MTRSTTPSTRLGLQRLQVVKQNTRDCRNIPGVGYWVLGDSSVEEPRRSQTFWAESTVTWLLSGMGFDIPHFSCQHQPMLSRRRRQTGRCHRIAPNETGTSGSSRIAPNSRRFRDNTSTGYQYTVLVIDVIYMGIVPGITGVSKPTFHF